jgi:hypothetical protein
MVGGLKFSDNSGNESMGGHVVGGLSCFASTMSDTIKIINFIFHFVATSNTDF